MSTKEEIKAAIKPGTRYFNFYDAVSKVRLLAQELVTKDIDPMGRMPHEASQLLQLAWMDCINLEAEQRMHNAGMTEVMFRARKLAGEGQWGSMECSPTMPTIGQPAMICRVHERHVVEVSTAMTGAVPLWWHFVLEAQQSYADPISRVISACRGDIKGLSFSMSLNDDVLVTAGELGFLVTKLEIDDALIGKVVYERLKELRSNESQRNDGDVGRRAASD